MHPRRNTNKVILTVILAGMILLSAVFLCSHSAWAQSTNLGLNYVNNTNLPTSNQDIRQLAITIINYFLTFLGIIAVVMILYAGYLYMTSGGYEDKVARAKKTLIRAIVGLMIILAAFAIVTFVAGFIGNAITGNLGGGGGGGGAGVGLGASGNSVIESHYPASNQQNVARNTAIVITFRVPMRSADLIDSATGMMSTATMMVYKSSDASRTPIPVATNFKGYASTDLKTFTFMQNPPYIGSPSENVWYTVALTTGLHKANGDLAWPGAGGGYSWQFQTGTFLDTTPPHVVSIRPVPDATEPRNVVIQIDFSEAVNPVSIDTAGNITVMNGATPVIGNFYISNEYQTVEFLTVDNCGGAVNSCGQPIYCLPPNATIAVTPKAATLAASGTAAALTLDGVTDMAGNSLDGNNNGKAQGPQTPAASGYGSGLPPYSANDAAGLSGTALTTYVSGHGDDYTWSFDTNNNIDTTPPTIATTSPLIGAANVGIDTVPRADFTKSLMCSSVTKTDVKLVAQPPAAAVGFYWLGCNDKSISIMHEKFAENASYTPELDSGIMDAYQNCFNPAGGPGCTPTTAQPYCCDGTAQGSPCVP